LFFVRLFSERQLDDLTPCIQCEDKLLKKTDAFYIISLFQGLNIAENNSWCEQIKSYNKSLRLHGLTHNYNEFKSERLDKYLKKYHDI